MLYYILFWTLLGFIIHFYIIFGTNLLIGGPVQIAVFCLFQCFEEKEYQTESKRNETSGSDLLGTNAIQETWSGRQEAAEAATRVAGASSKGGRPPASWAPHGSPNLPPSPIYIYVPQKHPGAPRNPISTAATFCTVRSHLGAFFGAPPEGESITEGFYMNTIASPMMCE